jgi:hypothetical protein
MLGNVYKINTKLDPADRKGFQNVPREKINVKMREKAAKHDNVQLSPFTAYLNQIDWQLKGIQKPSPEKLFFAFVVKEFEFQTEIDFSRFAAQPRQYYSIICDKEIEGEKKRSLLKVSIAKRGLHLDNEYKNIDLETLRTLFDNIFEMNIHSELNREKNAVIKQLLSGIYNDLLAEIENITVGVYTLIEKMDIMKPKTIKYPPDLEDTILLEKITTVKLSG